MEELGGKGYKGEAMEKNNFMQAFDTDETIITTLEMMKDTIDHIIKYLKNREGEDVSQAIEYASASAITCPHCEHVFITNNDISNICVCPNCGVHIEVSPASGTVILG